MRLELMLPPSGSASEANRIRSYRHDSGSQLSRTPQPRMRSIESNSSLTRALLTVNPKTLGGLPFSGKAAWKVASRAALIVPSAESPSHRNSSAPDPRPLSRLGSNFGGKDRFVPNPLAFDAARDRALAPSALRRALAASSASWVHRDTASLLPGLAAQMVTLRATSGAIATLSERDDTAV